MKKTLLLAAFAVLGMGSATAFEVGDYAYTTTQRLKISGENLVQNGTFAEGFSTGGWCSSAADGVVNQQVWSVVDGVGPNGESAVQSLGATADEALCNVWAGLEGGQTYIVSFDIKSEGAGVTTVGTTIGSNYADFFLNGDGSLIHAASTDEAPVVNVATASSFADDWTTVSYVLTPDQGQMLVMHFERLATGVMITNFSLHQADVVFDDRIARRKVAFADKLLADPNFNTEAAAGAKEEFMGVYAAVAEDLEAGGETAGEYMDAFDELLGYYLDASSVKLNDQLAGTEDVASLATVGRGANRPATYANLDLTGGNWGHGANEEWLKSAIQTGYANSATYNVFNKYFPAGKYYFTAEIRNANTDKSSWPCNYFYTLETVCKIFVGNDTIETEPIKGEDFQKFYFIGDIAEDGTFRAGVEWPGTSSGGAFFVKNVEVRAFGNTDEIYGEINHVKAFENYMTQWNAATSAYETVIGKVNNANYPWDQQVLADARAKYDPIFLAQRAKGWSDADGKDTGVATTDELNDWALYQGVEEYETTVAEDGTETTTRLEYQVVRGYQKANTTVVETNQPFTDLGNAIIEAKGIRNLPANATGDREAYKTAILKALDAITNIRSNTSDATRVADSTSLRAAQDELAAATTAFLASVALKPFVDIDFSKGVTTEADGEGVDHYFAYGEAGSIELGNYSETNTSGSGNPLFALGYGEDFLDVLRVGNGNATVNLTEEQIPTDNDTFRATFDFWFGNLSGRNTYVEFINAAGTRVAGFSLNRYNGSMAFNEFNNADNTGMDVLAYATGIGSSSASNSAICVEKNCTSFDLSINYSKGVLQGTIKNPQKGTKEGVEIAIPTMDDNKVVAFRIGSNYNNWDRRSWFDNLKLYKFAVSGASEEDDIPQSPWAEVSGIANITTAKPATGAIYNLMGVRLNGKPAKGLYIIDGKKYMAK